MYFRTPYLHSNIFQYLGKLGGIPHGVLECTSKISDYLKKARQQNSTETSIQKEIFSHHYLAERLKSFKYSSLPDEQIKAMLIEVQKNSFYDAFNFK